MSEADGMTRKPGRRLAALGVFGLLAIAFTAAYLLFAFRVTVGSGPAGPEVDPEAFSEPWTSRTVFLVGLGDSITAGFGARKGYSYFDRLVANPRDEFPDMQGINLSRVFPNLSVTNLAVSGSVSMHLLNQQLPMLKPVDDSVLGVVLITTGGNDVIHNYGKTPPREHAMFGASWEKALPWIRNFEVRLEKILDGVAQRFPGGHHVFLANIYDPTDAAGDIEKAGLPGWPDGLKILAAYNEIIEQAAASRTNVHLVNLHEAFLGHGLHSAEPWSKHYRRKDPHYWYFTNLEDPNERGYDAIRRLFLIEMRAVLRPNENE
jgi:lysophospholipase L1-like esterase